MFSFNHVAVQAMAFSHLRFLELSVPEIKTEKETVFFKYGDAEGGVSF